MAVSTWNGRGDLRCRPLARIAAAGSAVCSVGGFVLALSACQGPDPVLAELGPPASLSWTELESLPGGQGLVGAYVGVVDGALVVAGGRSFPEGRVGDEKAGASHPLHGTVFVLEPEWSETPPKESPSLQKRNSAQWTASPLVLPRPLAHGVSASWRDAMILVGGLDADSCRAEVFALRRVEGEWSMEELAPLPEPSAFACGAVIGDQLYIAGGLAALDERQPRNRFWSLDLAKPAAEWQSLPRWPGAGRMHAVAAAANGAFVLLGGERFEEADDQPRPEHLRDAYRYHPARGWTRLPDLLYPVTAAPSPAVSFSDGSIAVVGGDDGDLDELPPADLGDAHPGYRGRIQVLSPGARHWVLDGHFPRDFGPVPQEHPEFGVWPPLLAGTVQWNGRPVIAGGQARPGVGTRRVFEARHRR